MIPDKEYKHMLHVKKKVAIQKSYLFLLPASPYVCISLYNQIAEASTNYENLYGVTNSLLQP